MAAIYPIPNTRSSDLLVQRRLLTQLQSDQLDLLRIQTQIATGRRISRPSEDPASAQRGIGLQRVLEEKGQIRSNLNSSNSYLAATDNALSTASNLIIQMRAVAISSAQNTISDSQRRSNAVEVQQTLQRLVDVGNHSFRGRHLFAGSNTTRAPFEFAGNRVIYTGNEQSLHNFADIDLLVRSNLPGSEVFGTFSPTVLGIVDLNPVLSRDTKLDSLRGGLGIKLGSIQVSDGVNRRVIDLSEAKNIDDVVRALESQPPAGREIKVRVGAQGLTVDIDDAGGGNLTITDLADGTTAAELGLLNSIGTGVAPIVGTDLNPALAPTTRLDDILGTRPTAYISSPASNNDLIIESRINGPSYNGVTVQFVDDALLHASPPLTAGAEQAWFSAAPTTARAALKFVGLNNNLLLTANTAGTALNNVRIDVVNAGAIGDNAVVSYNAGTGVLSLGIDATGATTAQTLINQINAQGLFSAAYDSSDPADGGYSPLALIPNSNIVSGLGNTGNSGGDANTLFVAIQPGATNASQVVDAINQNPLVSPLFTAALDPSDSTNSAYAGQGLVDIQATAQTAGGSGESLDRSNGLRIQNGGQTYQIDISATETVEDLLNLLNRSPASLIATINAAANGIDVRSRLSGNDFSIGENGGSTATQLGLRSFSASTRLDDLNYGRGVGTAGGVDFHIQRTDGVTLDFDISAAASVQDVLDLLNAAGGINARLATTSNGILIEDQAGGPGSLVITKETTSPAAWDLGLIPVNQGSISGSGAPPTITGTDVNPQEVRGIFNTLIRLHAALTSGDTAELERVVNLIDEDHSRLIFARSGIGADQQNLDAIRQRLDDEEVELKQALSQELDADLAESISELAARQAALQASLQLTAKVFQLTLLDFL
jgi:flagellin-like hook-associated protein FlgL